MKSHLRRIGLASVAVAAAMLLAAGCGDDEGDDTRQLHLIVHGAAPVEIDNGKNGPSQGDMNVFDSPVTFADGGESAGRLYGVQTTVSIDDQTEIVQASFTFKLPEGTISVGGIAEYPSGGTGLKQGQEFVRPIVGGTGDYSGAGGTVTTSRGEDRRYEHELTIEETQDATS